MDSKFAQNVIKEQQHTEENSIDREFEAPSDKRYGCYTLDF